MFNLIGKNTDLIRANWVEEQLAKLQPGLKILDAGAGELRFKPNCAHLIYTAQDFGLYDGEGAEGLQTGTWDNDRLDIISDITEIPVKKASYDVILCSEVFEHIPDAVSALKEFKRILKPGGTLLITAPFNSLTHFAPFHFCGYNKFWYEYHLEKLDFSIKELDHNGSWFEFVAQELRRSRYISEIYSSALLGLITRILIIPVLLLLTLLAKKDKGSHETLCFGFMVCATKN